jgi:ParB family chromosome partitioning protein
LRAEAKKVQSIPVELISADPDQPRKEFSQESIEELAQSISKNGLLQPITVRKQGDAYIIIAGERRYRATRFLGFPKVDCLVYSGDKAKELQLIENINRVDLNPMEVAEAYQRYLDDGHDLDELSEVTGKAKGQITWLLNVTKCRDEVKHILRHGQISVTVAVDLGRLSQNGQMKALRVLNGNQLTVAESQAVCRKIAGEENQGDMLSAIPKLTPREIEARKKADSALERACHAFQEIAKLEEDNPGITAGAIAEKLDITEEKVDMLYELVGKFKKSLQNRRVAALV